MVAEVLKPAGMHGNSDVIDSRGCDGVLQILVQLGSGLGTAKLGSFRHFQEAADRSGIGFVSSAKRLVCERLGPLKPMAKLGSFRHFRVIGTGRLCRPERTAPSRSGSLENIFDQIIKELCLLAGSSQERQETAPGWRFGARGPVFLRIESSFVSIRIVNQPVEDAIGQSGIADLLVSLQATQTT
jgi:hypothetical protein